MPAALKRFQPVILLALIDMAVGAVLRIVLWWEFGRPAGVSVSTLGALIGVGACNDAIEGLYLFAPLSLYLLLMPDRWLRSRASQWALFVGTFLTLFALIYLAAVEYYFFAEFDSRLNLVAFDYLMYPQEVFTDIWEAYPVATVLVSVTWIAGAIVLLLRGPLYETLRFPAPLRRRLIPFAVHAFALALAIAAYPTDALAVFGNRVANEIAINGISSFFRAARTSDIEYSTYYVTGNRDINRRLLACDLARGGGEFTRLAEGRIDRRFEADPRGLGRLNVVVVVEESLGADFSRLYGSSRDWTPMLDSIARRGVWFRNTYASGTRTVRGLEAITTSLPPIPTVSVLRRPGNEHIASWGQVMQQLGYRTSFLYGGYGYFDNMNYFYAHNGFVVLDRSSIPAPRFANIWGVADEDLFDLALEHFDAEAGDGQPFFSMIMTTSNHKPFTFRAGIPGVKATGGGRESGVRYADFALGYFLREAQKHRWFDDTLFVVVADHGARVYGRADIPLRSYEIPLLMYSPRHLEPRMVSSLMAQIDIAPTVLGLLGLPYEAPFFGQDVLKHPDVERVAFFSHNHDVAVLREGELAVLGLQKAEALFAYDRAHERYTRIAPDPVLESLAVAYYQTASELFREHAYDIDSLPNQQARRQATLRTKPAGAVMSGAALAP
jgi:phosphoglycerol transferase MdoB-like AlkP superfamily enzyme